MNRFLRLLVTGLLLVVSVLAAAKPFPQEKSDLRADPTVRFGSLPNGLRYAVRANAEPKGRAALRILIDAGSFMEKDQQQGIAHFLEHMSFNGSTHYAPGTLIEFFQRMGMNFGGDTNAYTAFDHTVYQIDLPDTKPETVAEGLRVFSDYTGGLLLLAPEIDKERGVILSEKRARDSVGFRTLKAELEFAYAGTLLPRRLPIGTEEVITKAGREEFVSFYDTWYRPELVSVVAVGDFDAAAVERQIRETFAALAPRAPAAAAPAVGTVDEFEGLRVAYHAEAEAPFTTVTLRRVVPYSKKTYKAADLLERLPLDLAVSMVNQRLAELAKKEGAPFMQAHMSEGEAYGVMRETALSVYCKPEQWSAAVAVAEQELRRVLAFGFQEFELRAATANQRNALEQAIKTESTRHSAGIADQLIGTLQDDQVYTSSADDLALIGPALGKLSPKECIEALRKAWGTGGRSLFVTGNCSIEGDPLEAIRAAYGRSAEKPVEAPARQEVATWAYTDFGAPGKVVSRQRVEDLDITQLRFENGLRVNLKRTDFEAGQISVRLRVDGGSLLEPAGQAGLSTFAGNFFVMGGLGKHSMDELRRVLAGRNVSPGFRVAEEALVFSGRTTPDDLLLQLQLFAAAVTDPGYRPESARQSEKLFEQYYNRLSHTVEGALQMQVPLLLAGGDPRHGLPDRETMRQRTLAEMKAWLGAQFASGRMELCLVGDLDVEKTIEAVARTFGALPRLGDTLPPESLRRVKAPAQPFSREFLVDTKIDKALVALYWPTRTDSRDYRRCRRLGLLAEVFSDRLRVKVREELGESYSPDVSQEASIGYWDYGFIQSFLMVDPAKAARVNQVVLDISESLRRDGVSEDELKRAKLPNLTAKRESLRTNSYWLNGVLDQCQERTDKLEAARNRISDIEAVTVAELNALAGEVLGADRAFQFLIKPKQAAAAAGPAAPASAPVPPAKP